MGSVGSPSQGLLQNRARLELLWISLIGNLGYPWISVADSMCPGVHSRRCGKGSWALHPDQLLDLPPSKAPRQSPNSQTILQACLYLISLAKARGPGIRMPSLCPKRSFVSFPPLFSSVQLATWWTELSWDPDLAPVTILSGGPCALAPGFLLFSGSCGLFESRSLQVWLNKQILESSDKFGGFSDSFLQHLKETGAGTKVGLFLKSVL